MELFNQIISILADFTDPRKRVFIGYLFLSLFIAFVWLVVFKRTNTKIALIKIFDKKIFFSKSAQADYKIFIINRVFSLFISPLLLTQIAIATGIYLLLHQQGYIQSGYFSSTSTSIVVLLFTLFMFFIDDFSKYLVHRWMHKFHFLWAIHKVHHSAETLTPLTVYRVHPLEGILYTLRSAVSQGLAISIFIFLFGSSGRRRTRAIKSEATSPASSSDSGPPEELGTDKCVKCIDVLFDDDAQADAGSAPAGMIGWTRDNNRSTKREAVLPWDDYSMAVAVLSPYRSKHESWAMIRLSRTSSIIRHSS